MTQPLTPKVAALVEQSFDPAARDEVSQLLATYAGPECERVQLDILILAAGDKAKVREFLDRARHDYRDILFWAEYPDQSRLDTPEKRKQMLKLFNWLGVEPPAGLKADSES
ncbi:MAG TPA: hypothetical protein VI454_08480 [Verrucomicrobiae bacterium]